ncbi:hypothetical protein [Streptomyces sp. NPDC016845]|uniref:hypothetical protein n=1 Tax=Streptomyces sp. NPDC016845 TaxID=3364972 RepID=UPI0037B34FF2
MARAWHETGAEAELRRRTGSGGDVVRTQVPDDEHSHVDELTLGGVSVRDGHGAILTRLEQLLGIRVSFEELMTRASSHDSGHSSWVTAVILLAMRRDQETWAAAAALRTHAEPSHRLFGAEVLRLTRLFDGSDEDVFAAPALDLFTEWSAAEDDVAVLTTVLVALGEHTDGRAEAALLPYAGHDDAGIRCAVAEGLRVRPEQPDLPGGARAAVLGLLTDNDAAVRRAACRAVAESRIRDASLTEAMAALVDDEDRQVQVTAVYGLALHDDERCVEAARRLPPAPRGAPYVYELDEVWRYELRHR